MAAADRSSRLRDGQVILVRRLRIGVVSVGVAGSIGVATAVAIAAPGTASPASGSGGDAAQHRAHARGGDGDSFFGWLHRDGGDGGDQGEDPGQLQSGPGLLPGTGAAHGSTGGS